MENRIVAARVKVGPRWKWVWLSKGNMRAFQGEGNVWSLTGSMSAFWLWQLPVLLVTIGVSWVKGKRDPLELFLASANESIIISISEVKFDKRSFFLTRRTSSTCPFCTISDNVPHILFSHIHSPERSNISMVSGSKCWSDSHLCLLSMEWFRQSCVKSSLPKTLDFGWSKWTDSIDEKNWPIGKVNCPLRPVWTWCKNEKHKK